MTSLVSMGILMPARVLGILNVTPDSFSDGGLFVTTADAVLRAHEMLAEGADLIDVGGESTRPGAEAVDVDVELARVLPVIEAISERCPVSIDTRKPQVARAAVASGATIINDVGANLWREAAELGVGWIATHMQGQPATMQTQPAYDDVVPDVLQSLEESAQTASEAGVPEIWIDPGIGFGKTLEHNVAVLANIDRFVATGWPVVLGASRKSMLGTLLAKSDDAAEPVDVDDRLVGSVVTASYGMAFGVDMIRVHDVKAGRQAATVLAGDDQFRRT